MTLLPMVRIPIFPAYLSLRIPCLDNIISAIFNDINILINIQVRDDLRNTDNQ